MSAGRRADEPPTDAERFEAFVREYQDMVFATAVRLLGNATEAEDVAQTAFLRAFERFAAVGTSPTAVRLLGNATEAEDVAQTAFLRAFERFAAVGTSPTAAGWLKTVATNLCLNHLSRYRARWQTFGDLDRGESAGSGAEVIADAGHASPLDAVEQADRAERLERALQALPDHQRVPLVLFHFQDMSYQEIASKLGVSLAKVKTDIHRARERLRSELSDLYESR